MTVFVAHGDVLELAGAGLDHDRWPGEIGLRAVQIGEVVADDVDQEPRSSFGVSVRFRQHDLKCEVVVFRGEVLEMVFQVHILLGADAEIHVDGLFGAGR